MITEIGPLIATGAALASYESGNEAEPALVAVCDLRSDVPFERVTFGTLLDIIGSTIRSEDPFVSTYLALDLVLGNIPSRGTAFGTAGRIVTSSHPHMPTCVTRQPSGRVVPLLRPAERTTCRHRCGAREPIVLATVAVELRQYLHAPHTFTTRRTALLGIGEGPGYSATAPDLSLLWNIPTG